MLRALVVVVCFVALIGREEKSDLHRGNFIILCRSTRASAAPVG